MWREKNALLAIAVSRFAELEKKKKKEKVPTARIKSDISLSKLAREKNNKTIKRNRQNGRARERG